MSYIDLSDFTKSGGTKTFKRNPVIPGTAKLRLVAYVEIGRHETTFQQETKVSDRVQLVFEVHGKNYPLNNGHPTRITITETLSQHDKLS